MQFAMLFPENKPLALSRDGSMLVFWHRRNSDAYALRATFGSANPTRYPEPRTQAIHFWSLTGERCVFFPMAN